MAGVARWRAPKRTAAVHAEIEPWERWLSIDKASLTDSGGRRAVVVRSAPGTRRGALGEADGEKLAEAAALAVKSRLPLVLVVASSGSDVTEGFGALHGWGRAAGAVAACSGIVPVLAAVTGPAVSGPALLLGLADIVAMTSSSFAFISGPEMVETFTGVRLGLSELGGPAVHTRSSGLAAFSANDEAGALEMLADTLTFLPDDHDSLPPHLPPEDLPERPTPELADVVPASTRASYDVRDVVRSIADEGELLELRAGFAPQMVTALARAGGYPVGFVANQPRSLAGTLDIAASQKAARFVRFCDSFNLPLVTLVDTPGFLPGKDLEWRGMIRHGAELAFAYAEATVPRIAVILRKAYGGAYIVMDSKGLGNDICLAWPTAEIAVMGAEGAAQIIHRRADAEQRAKLESVYREKLLTPWVAAERGFVDEVIDPADTRAAVCRAVAVLSTRRERLVGRKHDAGPL